MKFATPVGTAASSVELSTNGLSACFLGTAQAGAKSDVAVAVSQGSFYYFEATRSQVADVVLGISATADTEPPAGAFAPRADTLVVSGAELLTKDSAGAVLANPAGAGSVFGFAVDLRSPYPAVSVIAPASANPIACSGLAPAAPCIIYRWQAALPAAALSIYAWGRGDGTNGPRVSINTGSDQLTRPYVYATSAVLSLLRAKRLQGAVGFNPQWPAASGPASLPTLIPTLGDRAVTRLDDIAPFRAIAVTPTNTAAGTITWLDELGTSRGSGASITVDTALMTALGVGEHVLTASVVNPQNGRYGETRVRLLVAAVGDNGDHDGDGLTYDEEKARGTDPGNADTDGDGLSDGAEAALGKIPVLADNANPANLPLRGQLVTEPGVTSRGLVFSDDALSATFTSELNPECVQHQGIFSDPVYTSPYGASERCEKRAARTNVAIAPGEFRYFESHRLSTVLQNVGQGIITPGSMINPYCCFVDPSEASFPYSGTPPSLAINAVGGVFRDLNYVGGNFSPAFDKPATDFYGFAVDYSGSDPVVYLVVKDAAGNMTVSDGIAVPGFAGGPAVPMVYGHILSDTVASATLNLGLQKFHYDLAAIRAALGTKGVDLTNFVPGVGLHRWQ